MAKQGEGGKKQVYKAGERLASGVPKERAAPGGAAPRSRGVPPGGAKGQRGSSGGPVPATGAKGQQRSVGNGAKAVSGGPQAGPQVGAARPFGEQIRQLVGRQLVRPQGGRTRREAPAAGARPGGAAEGPGRRQPETQTAGGRTGNRAAATGQPPQKKKGSTVNTVKKERPAAGIAGPVRSKLIALGLAVAVLFAFAVALPLLVPVEAGHDPQHDPLPAVLQPPVAVPGGALEVAELPQQRQIFPLANDLLARRLAMEPMTFTPEEIARLDEVLAAWAEEGGPRQNEEGEDYVYGKKVALYFRDLYSGAEYIYNGEEKFEIASLIKAPYAMYIFQLVDEGKASLEETFYVTAEMLAASAENSGKLKDDPGLPRDYTLAELVDYSIRYSDTGALRIMMGRYPAAGYAEWAAGLGLHFPEDVRGVTSGRITALDAGVYLTALYGYMESGSHGQTLRELMMNTNYTMIRSQAPVAHKYGWDEYAYHDMAVVLGDHPYILAILTDKADGTGTERQMFINIAAELEAMMEAKWGP